MSYPTAKPTRADLTRAKNRLAQCQAGLLDRPAILSQTDPYLWYLYGRDVAPSYAVERKIIRSSDWIIYLYLRDCKVLNRQALEREIMRRGNLGHILKTAELPGARCFKEALDITLKSKSSVAIWHFCQAFGHIIGTKDIRRLAAQYRADQSIYQGDFKWAQL